MRKIVQFQATSAYIWALTEDGIMWRRTHKSDEWRAVAGPGDANPFRKQLTMDEQAKQLKELISKQPYGKP